MAGRGVVVGPYVPVPESRKGGETDIRREPKEHVPGYPYSLLLPRRGTVFP